jgi:formamidopyrimidine-DNA glycosylase
LTARGAASLVPIIREVLSEAIEAGGLSLRDYRQANGELGYFQHTFRSTTAKDSPAPPRLHRHHCPHRAVGRSSFYCPRCQR